MVKNNIKIKEIFAPEHGFRGNADAGEHVKTALIPKLDCPLFPPYTETIKPKAEQLQGVDLILFDIQDVGVRFFTPTFLLSLM